MDKKQLFSAMDSYLTNNSHDCGAFSTQVQADLDLVRNCYSIAQKYDAGTNSAEENAEQVVFEVLSWYPADIRSKIAKYLLENSQANSG